MARTTSLLLILLVLVGCFGLTGCPSEPTDESQASRADSSGAVLFAVSYPLQEVTQRLIGEGVPVDLVHPEAGSRPSREQIAAMQQADLVIANGNGATYADWLVTVSLPESRLVESATRGLALKDFIAVEDVRLVHSHGPEGEHSHATMVSRTWLDPSILAQQAEYIAARLGEVYPDQKASIDVNLKALVESLNQLMPEQVEASSKVRFFAATFEMKFLTRAVGVEDQHFNWTTETSAEQMTSELKQRLASQENNKGQVVLLVPDYLYEQVSRAVAPAVTQSEITLIEIDLLDRPNGMGLLERIASNLEKLLGELR